MATDSHKLDGRHTSWQAFIKFLKDDSTRLKLSFDVFLVPFIISKISKLLYINDSILYLAFLISICQLFVVKYLILFVLSYGLLFALSLSPNAILFAQISNSFYLFFVSISNRKLKTSEICILSQIITTVVYCENQSFKLDFALVLLSRVCLFLTAFLVVFSTAYYLSKRATIAILFAQIPGYIMLDWAYTKKHGTTPLKWCFRQAVDNHDLIFIWGVESGAFILPILLIILFKREALRVSSLRKLIHLLLSAIILTGIYFDRVKFTLLAFMAIISLFVLVEILRFMKIRAVVRIFKCLAVFYNERDSDEFLFVHIFTLIGLILPLIICTWLNKTGILGKWILGASGVYSVGLADSLASIFGGLLGKKYWPFSSKTYIGSGVFFSTLFSGLSAALYINNRTFKLFKLFKIAFVTTLYEAYTGSLDNLTVPLVSTLLILHYSE